MQTRSSCIHNLPLGRPKKVSSQVVFDTTASNIDLFQKIHSTLYSAVNFTKNAITSKCAATLLCEIYIDSCRISELKRSFSILTLTIFHNQFGM